MRRLFLPLASLVAFALTLAACPKGGTHVDVKDFKGGRVADYQPKACADDAREEDDEAVYVLSKSSKEGEKFDAISCPGDDDFIHLYAKGRTGAAIAWNPAEGELRVELLDATGAVAGPDGPTDRSEESRGRIVEKRMNVHGDFFLRVRNRSGTPVKYQVHVGAMAGDSAPARTR